MSTLPCTIRMSHLFTDPPPSLYYHYHPTHQTLTLSFPSEIEQIKNITNSHGCRMTYSGINGEEYAIASDMCLPIQKDTTLTIYTRSIFDLIISFTMCMSKLSLRSKL